ncbi:MAG: cystathionine gamma-synthase [Saprospiraceae bacterium]|nr:cystathionine gamma-synthase [Saprospiraceae bacterium]MCB0681681.1 cystathionine gamma-synthase [Saprospiraceae bacterium]
MKFGTKVIHAGVHPDPSTGAVMTPIYQTSTYAQEAPGQHQGYEYARTQNPTRTALQNNLAALENGKRAICFASGMSAMDAVCRLLNAGDEVIATNDLYGGSYRLITKVYERFGLKGHFIDLTRPENVLEKLNDRTRLIWIETPTNPMLKLVDIEAICRLVADREVLVCVDNTFASPYLQNPLDLGADLAMHSATKYLGGHSDVVMGVVVAADDAVAESLYFLQNAVGAVPGPQDCFLMLRGIKTLHLRMQRACENARSIVDFLHKHPKVGKVYYPGLPTHPGHELARRQMRDFGAMISFDLVDDSMEKARQVLSGTELFLLAESLGGVESLIGHPASMTHASIPRADRLKVGLTDSLIRLSVGIEDADDLIADLGSALDRV